MKTWMYFTKHSVFNEQTRIVETTYAVASIYVNLRSIVRIAREMFGSRVKHEYEHKGLYLAMGSPPTIQRLSYAGK